MTEGQTFRCYGCGSKVAADTDACGACGAVQNALCFCGATISVYEDTCPECGTELYAKAWRPRRLALKLSILVALVLAAGAALGIWLAGRQRPWADYREGFAAWESGRYEIAAARFAAYLDRYGEDARARFMLGLSQSRLRLPDEGRANVEKALADDPGLAPAALHLAAIAYEEGDDAAALAYADRALEGGDPLPEARVVRAALRCRFGGLDLAGAREDLRVAIAAGIESSRAEVRLAEVDLAWELVWPDLPRTSEAFREIERARGALGSRLKGRRRDEHLIREIARLTFGAGPDGWQEAIEILSILEPNREAGPPETRILMGMLKWASGLPAVGRDWFLSVIEGAVTPVQVLRMSEFCRLRGRPEFEARVLAAGRERLPSSLGIFLANARSRLAAGDLTALAEDEARMALGRPGEPLTGLVAAERALAEGARRGTAERLLEAGAAQDPRVALRLVDLLLDARDGHPAREERTARAVAILDRIDRERPPVGTAAIYRDYLRARVDLRSESAGAALQAVLRDLKSQPEPRLLLARRCEARGDLEQAETYLGDAILVTRSHRPHVALARFRFRHDDREGAIAEARKALAVATGPGEAVDALSALAAVAGPAAALPGLERLLGDHPENARGRLLLAALQLDAGEPAEAMRLAEIAFSDRRLGGRAVRLYTEAALRSGIPADDAKLDPVRARLDEGAGDDPDLAYVRVRLGAGPPDARHAAALRARDGAPEDPGVALLVAALSSGPDGAREEIARARRLAPDLVPAETAAALRALAAGAPAPEDLPVGALSTADLPPATGSARGPSFVWGSIPLARLDESPVIMPSATLWDETDSIAERAYVPITTPEPGTLLLFALGLAVLALVRGRLARLRLARQRLARQRLARQRLARQ